MKSSSRITIENYIFGKLVSPVSGNYLENDNPSRGEIYSLVPDSDERDVEAACQAASAAFGPWSSMTREERSQILLKLSLKILEHQEELAQAETRDNGKPITVSRKVDIPRCSTNFDFFAKAILEFEGKMFDNQGAGRNSVSYSPLGVVAVISPWNLPLYLLTWKIAPALAAGNTVIAKPSEVTPMTAYLFSKICQEAGLPAGVLNIVHGLGPKLGPRMISHPAVKAISFTGSTKTGKDIAKSAAEHLKKFSLEMGGKNPTIIFADANFDEALDGTMRAAFSNQGQICLCGSRIFVEKKIYDRFKNAMLEKIKALRQGDPLDENTQQGALVSRQHLEKVESYVQMAHESGGKILCGGKRLRPSGECANGYFFAPTLIEHMDPFCQVNQEEIFGPVATIMPFEHEADVLTWANSTRYGLAASVWSLDQNKAKRMADQLEAGIVWINCWMLRDLRTPFGGVKESGRGREGGTWGLEFFSEIKNICIKE